MRLAPRCAAGSWAALLAMVIALQFCGCSDADKKKWDDFWAMEGRGPFGSRQAGDEEAWTIECNTYLSENHAKAADSMATALKRVPELRSESVWVEHGPKRSTVFYGEYPLKYVQAQVASESHAEGDLIIKLSDEIKSDLDFIRKLAMGDKYPFFSARPIPKPLADVGPPEWDIRNARGIYTLNVGVTYNTETLHNYKEAAIEWVRDLRSRGHEAYYYHDPDRPQTSICVGTFGEEALTDTGGGRSGYSEAVKALQQKEEFKYNLENGHIMYRIANDEHGQRVRMPNWSFIVKIQRDDARPNEVNDPSHQSAPPR